MAARQALSHSDCSKDAITTTSRIPLNAIFRVLGLLLAHMSARSARPSDSLKGRVPLDSLLCLSAFAIVKVQYRAPLLLRICSGG